MIVQKSESSSGLLRKPDRRRKSWQAQNSKACGMTPTAKGMSEPELLLYRSNLLGSDLRITNFGGGNTSAKVKDKDPLTGAEVTVLWVKGSGGDIGSMKLDGFATLYMDKLESLKGHYKSLDQEDAMVHALNHCIFNLNSRAPFHRHLPAWLCAVRACRSRPFRRGDRHCSGERSGTI